MTPAGGGGDGDRDGREDPRDPTGRFAPRADAYARARPGYPAALVPRLQALGFGAGATVADLGAGTGLSCEVLLATGADVVAVEPNDAMRAHAIARFAAEPRFRAVAGRAEATTLAAASIDHAAAMQAMHWFDPDLTRAELRRVLRPGGVVALVWNTRAPTTHLMRDLEALVRRFAPDYDRLGHVGAARAAVVRAFFGARAPEHAQLAHTHRLDRAGLLDLIGSMSYLPARGTPEHPALVAAAEALGDRHGDALAIDYVTDVYSGAP